MFIRINENTVLDPVQVNAMCAWGCRNYKNTVRRLAIVATLIVDSEIKDRITKLYDKLVNITDEKEYLAAYEKVMKVAGKGTKEYIRNCTRWTKEKVKLAE